MPFIEVKKNQYRVSRFVFFLSICLSISLFTLAQVTLKYRLLNGYFLSNEATGSKGKPTLFVFEQVDRFDQVFKPATTMSKRPDVPDFAKEMVIGIAVPPTTKALKLSISRVFVQDSTLTVRYIRMTDTTAGKTPQSFTKQPVLLLAIPKQTVLKTKLVENGKVVQTIQKRDNE